MKKKIKKIIASFQTKCPFGHDLYPISIHSSKPFCPACGWIGKSLKTAEGRKHWVESTNMDYIEYVISLGGTTAFGVVYQSGRVIQNFITEEVVELWKN